MAVLKIRTFGGILPSTEERALPPDNAVTAQNLTPVTPEFRPVLGTTTFASVLSAFQPLTLYRFSANAALTAGWKAYADWTTLARWPVNDAGTERTSVADAAGGYPPRVIDNTGVDRVLGVPAPAKPTVVLNAGSYMTEQGRLDAIAKLKADILAALKAALARAKVGAVYTADATQGYLEDGAQIAPLPSLIRYRVYRYDAYEGTLTEAYTAAVEADVAWVRAANLGQWLQADGTPAWMGAVGTWHYAQPYAAYGVGFIFDDAAATTALTGVTYLGAALRGEIVTAVTAMFDPAGALAASVVAPLRTAVANLERVLDSKAGGAYDGAATAASVTEAIEAAANQIFDALGRNASFSVHGVDAWNGPAFSFPNPAAWWEPQVGGYYPRADSIASIVADLTANVSADPTGRSSLDVNALMILAATRIGEIPKPPAGQFYDNPNLLLSTNLYPYFDSLRLAIEGANEAGGAAGPTDLQPLLDDLRAKSDAVTAFYDRLYNVDLPNLLAGEFSAGTIDKDVPPVDDLTKETRYFRTTFVNDWENEGGPSPVSDALDVGTKDTVTITVGAVPAGRNLAYWRIYRSNSGNEGGAWQYVPNAANELGVAIATLTFADDVANSALKEVCPTLLYKEPPTGLRGILPMANGIHLGWQRNEVRPTPAYAPWAFPDEYRIIVDSEIVGGCAWEQMAFLGTKGRPVFVMGSDAPSLTHTVLDSNQACVSPASICPTSAGVVYASPDGLCLASPAGVRVLTEAHFSREEWQALRITTMAVREHDGIVYFMPGPAPPVNSGWNPLDKHARITLSDSNWAAARNAEPGTDGSVRAVQGRSSGKLYFEIALSAAFTAGSSASYEAGVCSSDMLLSGDAIFDAVGGKRAVIRADGFEGNDISGFIGSFLPDFDGADGAHVWGFAVDFSTRLMRVYWDGVAGRYIDWGAGAATMYPFACMDTAAAGTMRLRLIADEFTYDPPAGYSPWSTYGG